MYNEWIEDWRSKIDQKINLNGITSATKNLEVALEFSKCERATKDDQKSVLFVYSITNYNGFHGFRLNDKYTPFPNEHEYLLTEKFPIYVLGI